MRFLPLAILSLAVPATAGEISLGSPIDCDLSSTCYIQQFVDHDPSSGVQDFRCGSLSYDDHKGTDFALPSLAMQSEGVAVIAAASGVVTGVRDEMPDQLQGTDGAPDITNRECGNGIVVDLGDGWETQYCHMALGSITVQAGDRIEQGDVLGQVGLSGKTYFPHVHLSVRHDGAVVDPFDPDNDAICADPTDTLWTIAPPTPAGRIISTGFADTVPAYADVKAGTAGTDGLTQHDNLVAWGFVFGAMGGDILQVTISGPDGVVLTQEAPFDRNQAQVFRAIGKRAPAAGWPAGQYHAMIALIRDGQTLDVAPASVTVD